ncbi:cytochrome P450 oxidoreductase [Lentithecium fluviatile CBS 122367]|uniref:Cytochrome P450 oxidoreductase n=1 Tax=Lentithecium fluviatile CBS 122367 TaxID=1168545 RepID=A0A6G1JMV2_9PLEO|nr:cytochrome P450 oxidoreductase [Lentithecium fluviatile CBS 122367]
MMTPTYYRPPAISINTTHKAPQAEFSAGKASSYLDLNFALISLKMSVSDRIGAPESHPRFHGVLAELTHLILRRCFNSVEQTALSVVTLWLLTYVLTTVYTRCTRISGVPGPFWAAYSRFWLLRAYASGCLWQIYHNTSLTYGPLTRIGPNQVLLSDPEESMRILAPRSKYERGPWYDAFRIEPNRPNIISQRHRSTHLRMRYQMAPGVHTLWFICHPLTNVTQYSGKDIANFENIMNVRVLDLTDHITADWTSTADSTVVFDLGRWIRHLTMDTITHISFGKPLGYVENGQDVMNFTGVVEQLLPVVLRFSLFTELKYVLQVLARIPCFRRKLFPHSTHSTGLGGIKITKDIINSRPPPEPRTKSDMLNSFLCHGISPTEVESEMVIALVAGSDTTSTGLRATILNIISNPPVYRKLQQEIDEAITRGLISSPIQDTEARRLPYLQACIYEGLRCHPPLVMPRERIAPPEGDTVCGYHLPGGTIVGLNVWTSQRTKVYGTDPEVFRPERWIEASDEQRRAMRKVWDLVFGYGTTKCLGENVALMTMNKVLPELFRRFDICTIDPQRPWHSECYGIFFQKGFNVRVSKREAFS